MVQGSTGRATEQRMEKGAYAMCCREGGCARSPGVAEDCLSPAQPGGKKGKLWDWSVEGRAEVMALQMLPMGPSCRDQQDLCAPTHPSHPLHTARGSSWGSCPAGCSCSLGEQRHFGAGSNASHAQVLHRIAALFSLSIKLEKQQKLMN